VKLFYSGDLENVLEQYGRTPLPPYIKRDGRKQEDQDQNWYQTIFARKIGAAAAPTAGLHFTERVIARLKEKGVELLTVTLHVGIGTFQPVRVEEVEKHKMHKEYYEITPETSQRLIKAKEEGKKIIACGTTTVRVLETWYYNHNLNGYTELFIYPGYKFQVVGGMITNFHLPRSTLLMLVSAFAGKELIFCAYREAIEKKYRFYSYGDAMLIL
jgi:S-adenosylmethionine:tRNA ribosyltransferase-isomerase